MGFGRSCGRLIAANEPPGVLQPWRVGLAPAAKEAGCEGAGFHDLRRLNATTLLVGGIDVKTAQVRLGHADPRNDTGYLRFRPGVGGPGGGAPKCDGPPKLIYSNSNESFAN
jgi:hypothetical protein